MAKAGRMLPALELGIVLKSLTCNYTDAYLRCLALGFVCLLLPPSPKSNYPVYLRCH